MDKIILNGNGNGGMGVVELNHEPVRKIIQAVLGTLFQTALATQGHANHILHGAGDEEILLAQAQGLAGHRLIVGVEHFADVLGHNHVIHGAVEIAGVEGLQVEGLAGLRFPQA